MLYAIFTRFVLSRFVINQCFRFIHEALRWDELDHLSSVFLYGSVSSRYYAGDREFEPRARRLVTPQLSPSEEIGYLFANQGKFKQRRQTVGLRPSNAVP
ncbi:hypothetical protein ElyMa_002712300 [Elysia marginata]|uniref:Uncharacterized protein n=1 Tax=Elysia marginata TaxID=1093978 RepID=A0AAV4HD03_9GAST|nr:hypothetical protein ElyMa_002712300 [Elysia marginata]